MPGMIQLTINGSPQQLDIDPDTPLLWAIRDNIGLTGTKFGCGMAQCGACTVHLDGKAIRSCSRNPHPTDKDINDAMTGNICRCNTYVRIRAAIKQASQALL
jgi:isoquinoline 1-oxidoreductase alpha subunit